MLQTDIPVSRIADQFVRPTSYRVHHDFRIHIEELVSRDDKEALKQYLNRISSEIVRDFFPPIPEQDGIRSLLHTSAGESFRFSTHGAQLAVDVIRLNDPDRLTFDFGILLCVPHLYLEHALILTGKKLQPDEDGRFTTGSTYTKLWSDDDHYDLDQDACAMLNIHPRAGQMMFYNPPAVGNAVGGIRMLAPELFLTMPECPTFEIVANEAKPFSSFIVDTFMAGFRGTRDKRVVNIVTNIDPTYYTPLTMIITIRPPK